MHQHRNEIQIEIVLFERTLDSIADIDALEVQLIRDLKPKWNNQR